MLKTHELILLAFVMKALFRSVSVLKSGLTLHDFRRTTDQIGCDMSQRVIAGNRGK